MAKKTAPQTKWKNGLQASINEIQGEIDEHILLREQTTNIYDLLSSFRGASVSSIVNLLYEGQHAIQSPVYIERKRKV